ncbi:type I polyketide synthase [Paenibacillus nasutitermitis]|uniref:Uncharacterized protein n=1 Tax=Paenibacillus nasutitermitis TaxID=1652958 RepID=A0A917E2Z8_9BACL|nr:type I polyketide synthase [Paenibacillus nasutitermitis]GGD98627.1 hypothetical protein GCM10010911_66800 [Paenibacillus nasutitermitis]
MRDYKATGLEIAIVGMACRVPGADDVSSFWELLKNGTEAISFFSDDELLAAGIGAETIRGSDYVKAGGIIRGSEWFDTQLFAYTPREAEVMDPQLKVLHECAWEALEDAGCMGERGRGLTGVYIGASTSLYWMNDVFERAPDFLREANLLAGSQFFGTRLSHQLDLKGPGYTVQTACSSSLVAVHLACQGLLAGDCDTALAGGVTVTLPEVKGYRYQEGMIMSPDGHCRPFDADARGTVNGSGVGVVVLKRLQDAVESGDYIYAVIKGSAVNNDGRDKVGFTAPSVAGQAEVIKSAQAMAEVEPDSVTYVEAHGTGTVLGDPIELEGLKLAFGSSGGRRGYCGVGAVKGNIGHLDNAAGIAGLIKTALALRQRQIPPSINFSKPNGKIDFANSPFYVNTALKDWDVPEFPLRAGVSSFGIGGTNAHVVLEEAPEQPAPDRGREAQLLALSAQSMKSLDDQTKRLAGYLDRNPDVRLPDVAYTLLTGRKQFKYRRVLTACGVEEAKAALSSPDSSNVLTAVADDADRPVIFMFPGQGAQYAGMGEALYREEAAFREAVDRCCRILSETSACDWKDVLYPADKEAGMSGRIHQTSYTQPAIFIFEYALAELLMSWGVRPDGMIGHSLGEYAAACLSGVLTLEDALALVSARAELMQKLPAGGMTSVMASAEKVGPLLTPGLSVAVSNGPALCVVSGPFGELEALEAVLEREEIRYKRLQTSHAFHSAMMDPVIEPFKAAVESVSLNVPNIPYISNVTGTWISASEAADPAYWVNHLRGTVQFFEGIGRLLADADSVFVEVGPGRALGSFVRQQLDENATKRNVIVNVAGSANAREGDDELLLRALGKLHVHGVDVNWMRYYAGERRLSIPLPTYPFDRSYYSIRSRGGHEERGERPDMDGRHEAAAGGDISAEKGAVSLADKERLITAAFSEVTGVNNVGVHDDFFELGGNSLSAVGVVARLQGELRISLGQLFEHPRASDLAREIQSRTVSGLIEKAAMKRYLLARQERYRTSADSIVELAPMRRLYEERNRAYDTADLSRRRTYRDILLTGSTGYLGIYLLRELLTRTEADIHLIVRGGSREEAGNRLLEKLRHYFGPDFYGNWKRRLFVYRGDLTKSGLGLEQGEYDRLADRIDCVLHSAANVSHYGKYDDSCEANITATKQLIGFAFAGGKKAFHHISTMAVASGTVPDKRDILFTEYDGDAGQTMAGAYAATKFEAEKLLFEARKQGLEASIYRVGNIVFDSVNGKFQTNIEQNAIYSLIRAYAAIGFVPEMERDTDFSCVDDVSRAIVSLFDREALQGETFHICNPHAVSMSELLTLPDLGLGVVELPLEPFLDAVYDDDGNSGHETDLYTIQLHSIGEDRDNLDDPSGHTLFHPASDKTNELLARTGFIWSVLDERQASKMIAHCRAANFL